jgi:hypothetical protein
MSKKLCLPKEIWAIIGDAFVETFKHDCNAPLVVAGKIKNMRCVNKALRDYTDNPNTIRTIIINASETPYYRGFLANSINLPSVKNYLQQSETLNSSIKKLNLEEIGNYIKVGADINYCHQCAGNMLVFPILTHTRSNYATTKLLLELGADQDIALDILTPLSFAMFTQKIELIKLFLEYNPRNKHVKEAVEIENLEILQLILQQKDISAQEIEDAKEVARKQENDIFMKLLDQYAGNQNNTEICIK